jgi:hypothetical protein
LTKYHYGYVSFGYEPNNEDATIRKAFSKKRQFNNTQAREPKQGP